MGFLLHFAEFTLHFAANCAAFWRIFHCVSVHISLRFGANCTAFWCILHCILVQNAVQQLAIRPHFLVVADANLGEFFFK